MILAFYPHQPSMSTIPTFPTPTLMDSVSYVVECHACGVAYEAMASPWCVCIVKERSLVCPHCRQCFCRADFAYKRNFWTVAPEALWARKHESARELSVLPANPAPGLTRRPLVLVVDDDRDVRAVATLLIAGWGFGCIHAADGVEGLTLARAYKPDVIVTDALMPKMDGRELCRLIKSDPELSDTRVVIMSSVYTSGRFKREALSKFGADEYVSKPIDAKLLFTLLRQNPNGGEVKAGVMAAAAPENKRAADAKEVVAPAWVLPDVPPESIFGTPLLGTAATDGGTGAAMAMPLPEREIEISLEFPPLAVEDEEPFPAVALPAIEGLTAARLIHLRAVGFDAELAAIVRDVPGLALIDLISLRAAGVPVAFLRAIGVELLCALTVRDLITLFASGCDGETAGLLRMIGFSVPEIVGLVACAVPLDLVREVMEIAGRRLSAAEVMRLHCAGVDVAYLRALAAAGYRDAGVDEWIRLATLGISSEFIEAASRALRKRCTSNELLRLWLTGVDGALLQELAEQSFTFAPGSPQRS